MDKKNKNSVTEEKQIERRKDLQTIVMDINEGMHIYDHAKRVVFKDRNYRMEVLADFAPTIGDSDGEIDIILEGGEVEIHNARCFYLINENVLNVLITSKAEYIER